MFRMDRLASLACAPLLKRRRWRQRPQIPILMYHSISDRDERGLHPYYRTATSPEVFAEHIRYLHAQGYRTLSLEDAVRCFAQPWLPQKLVVITFDDGYEDFLRHAFPVLAECGYTATVFLPTAFIGTPSRIFKGTPCLTWSQICELHRGGIAFGSHTVTHPKLDVLPEAELDYEIRASKSEIECRLGHAIDSFAYPYAFPIEKVGFRQALREQLCSNGYRHGVCTTIGTADASADVLFLPRLPMNSDDDRALLEAKLSGAYDWLGGVQSIVKRLRHSGRVQGNA
jgi:peptidoglycan/xylan/chitin deacetylase (PgdA/CDA1 family)